MLREDSAADSLLRQALEFLGLPCALDMLLPLTLEFLRLQRETQLLRSRPHPSAVGSHVAELPLLTMVDRRRDDDKR